MSYNHLENTNKTLQNSFLLNKDSMNINKEPESILRNSVFSNASSKSTFEASLQDWYWYVLLVINPLIQDIYKIKPS